MSRIFLSVGSTYTDEQERFVAAFETFLTQNGCTRLTVGRGQYFAAQPVVSARELMETADGVIVIGFTRIIVSKSIEKPGCEEAKVIKDRRYATLWNQLEAAMGFGLRLPLLLVLEKGLHQEAMLKDRFEYRTFVTSLDPAFFESAEFKGVFADWVRIARERKLKATHLNPSGLTIRQMLESLKPGELWKVLAAVFGILAGVATGGYWLGTTLRVNTPVAEQQRTTPPSVESTLGPK